MRPHVLGPLCCDAAQLFVGERGAHKLRHVLDRRKLHRKTSRYTVTTVEDEGGDVKT